MASFLTLVASAVTNALVYILKAFFSLVSWFFRLLSKFMKTLFALLPITTVVFVLLLILNIFILVTGASSVASAGDIIGNEAVSEEAESMVKSGSTVVVSLYTSLKSWWITDIYSYKGTGTYILLLILTVLMFLPVVTVLLFISVFLSFGRYLFLAIAADIAVYVIRAVFGKTFVSQAMDRYYRLFPDAGKKHNEKEYDRLMKNRNKELKEELHDRKRHRYDSYYEDEDDYPDDEYVDEYEEYEDYDEYDDEDYDDEEYEDEYEDEDYENYEDDYDSPAPAVNTTFNFFAGCNSKESADRKYKSLVKLYHPDNMDGDTAALQEINMQYEEVKKRFS